MAVSAFKGPRSLRSLPARASESSHAANGRRQLGHRPELHPFDSGEHHLRDPHAAGHLEGLGPEIHQNDLHLTAVIAVDRGGRVGDDDAVLQGQTRPGPNLALVILGQCDRQAGSEGTALQRRQDAVLGARQIIARRSGRGPGRQRKPLAVRQSGEQDLGQSAAATSVSGSWKASATPG
jgi:hypothetical protein